MFPQLFGMLATANDTITGINWGTYISASSFQPLVDGLISLVPIVIAVCIPLIVIRKGMDFLKGNIYSA